MALYKGIIGYIIIDFETSGFKIFCIVEYTLYPI